MGALGNTPRRTTVVSLEAAKSFAFGVNFSYAATGGALDLTGCTLRLVLAQPQHLGGAVVLTETATLTDAAAGESVFELQAVDLALPAAEYPYTITLVTADGYSAPIDKGIFDIHANPDASTTNTYTGVNPAQALTVVLGTSNQITVQVTALPGPPGSGSVNSVNGDAGPDVVLGAADVGAAPSGHTHAAAAITYAGAAGLSATDVEGALDELAARPSGGGSVNALDILYGGSTGLSATNVEAALDELDAEKVGQGVSRFRTGTRDFPSAGLVKFQSYESAADGMVIWTQKVGADNDDVNIDGSVIVKHGKGYELTPGYADTLQVYTLAGSAGTILGNNNFVELGGAPYTIPSNPTPNGYLRFELGPSWPDSEKMRLNNQGDLIVGWTVRTTGQNCIQSGTTVTRYSGSGSFTPSDVGAYILWTGPVDGRCDRITGYISATQVTVETSRTLNTPTAVQVRVPNVVVRHDGVVESAAGVVVKGRAGQTGNLLQVQKSDGTSAFSVAADGTVTPSGGGGSGVAVEDEGTEILAAASRLNFTGAGVTVTDAGSGEATVNIPGGGGGGSIVAGEILAFKEYATSAFYTTSSGTDADMDATNLAVTFTAPTSGKVKVTLEGLIEVTGSSPGQWSIRSGSTTVQSCLVGTGYRRAVASFYVTGLTAGSSYTYKWGHSRVGSTGAINLYTGGNAGTSGNAMMTVVAMA